jgi:hypothetical protein
LTAYYPVPNGDYSKMSVADNLGVGTTAPTEKLEVIGTIKGDSVMLTPVDVAALPAAAAGTLAVDNMGSFVLRAKVLL